MFPIAFPIPGTEPLGQGNGETVDRTAQEILDEPMEAAGRARCGQGHSTQEPSHDQAVTEGI